MDETKPSDDDQLRAMLRTLKSERYEMDKRLESMERLVGQLASGLAVIHVGSSGTMPSVRDMVGVAMSDLWEQVCEARAKRPPFSSPHEVYAVVLEELSEYFDEVRKKEGARDRAALRQELLDIAVPALRAVMEMDEADELQDDATPLAF